MSPTTKILEKIVALLAEEQIHFAQKVAALRAAVKITKADAIAAQSQAPTTPRISTMPGSIADAQREFDKPVTPPKKARSV